MPGNRNDARNRLFLGKFPGNRKNRTFKISFIVESKAEYIELSFLMYLMNNPG